MTLAARTSRNSNDGAGCRVEDEEHRSWQQKAQKPSEWSDHLDWKSAGPVESSEERDRETRMKDEVRRDPDTQRCIW